MRVAASLASLLSFAVMATAPLQSLAQEQPPVRIGVLTDMSGFLSAALGQGSVEGARMAIEDFGGAVLGRKIELVTADHQNKPDVGLAIARKWYDVDGVDVIADIGNSSVGLGIQDLARNKKRLVLFGGASSSVFTGSACSPYGTQWGHDSYMFANALPKRLAQAGDKTWHIIAVDFAFGHAIAADTAKALESVGGKVVGSVRHPPNIADFSSFLLQGAASKANVVALANATTDTTNAIKQWNEFKLGGKGQKLVALALLITDVRALGLELAQGTTFSTVFYWDMNEKTRAFATRFQKRTGFMPGEAHAATYSGVLHYLKAVQAAGTRDADAVAAKMRELPVNDFYSENVRVRADGRVMRNSYIARVKTPEESRGPWDLYRIVETIPAEQSFRPIEQSDCPLVKR